MSPNDNPTLHAHRQVLLALRQQVRIVHHLPGRIRIEIRQNGAMLNLAAKSCHPDLATLPVLLPGIRSLRLNLLAGSMVLEYDPAIYPFQLVDAFFRTTSSEQAGDLLDRLSALHPPCKGENNE